MAKSKKNEVQKLLSVVENLTVKNKNNKKKKQKPKTNNGKLSSQAQQYKNMVMDPCNSKLVLPPLPGGTGHLIRLRARISAADILDGATADMSHMVFMFDPDHAEWVYKATSSGSIPLDTAAGITASTGQGINAIPDFTFLAGTNIRRHRPVAACLEFENYTASNAVMGAYAPINPVSRQILHTINSASNNPTLNTITPNLEFTRVGLKHTQFWRPKTTANWTTYGSDTATAHTVDEGISTGLGFVYRTNATGGTFNLMDFDVIVTCVYEYEPEAASGIAETNISGSYLETIEHILHNVPSNYWKWGGKMAMKALGIGNPMPYQGLIMNG